MREVCLVSHNSGTVGHWFKKNSYDSNRAKVSWRLSCIVCEGNKTEFLVYSKEGADVVTAGIVGLSFVLLKATQNEQLNNLGIHFLEEFLKKRHIFGSGIVKNLKEFLFADQSAPQYAGKALNETSFPLTMFNAVSISECLTRLSTTNTMTISECLGSIKEILDFFLLVMLLLIIESCLTLH